MVLLVINARPHIAYSVIMPKDLSMAIYENYLGKRYTRVN
jgi:hypothetical protein